MKAALIQWQRHRIAQTLWRQNAEHLGFSWFHEQGLPAPLVLDEVEIEMTTKVSSDILQLRLRAAHEDGRLLQTNNFEKCRDSFDAAAIHIKLILRNQLVAAGRLIFLNGHRDKSEISKVLISLPDAITRDPDVVEISRVCTHPDFRRGHLLTLLLAECAWTAYRLGGRVLLGYCVRSLIPVYLRFAGELLPYSGQHPLYEGQDSCVVSINLEKVVRGENIPFLAWARFVAPHLDEALVKDPGAWMLRPKKWAVRLLRPFLNEFLRLTQPCSSRANTMLYMPYSRNINAGLPEKARDA